MNNYNVLFNFHKLIVFRNNISKSLIFNNKMLCLKIKKQNFNFNFKKFIYL